MPETIAAPSAAETPTTAAVAAPPAEAVATPSSDAAASAAAPTDAAPPAATTTEPAKPAAPVVYDLALADGSKAPADVTERIAAIASARGLSNDAAQAMLDHAVSESAAQVAAWTAEMDRQREATLADPALGKTVEERAAAIQKGVAVIDAFAKDAPEDGAALKAFLNDTRAGDDPRVAKFFAWLGKSTPEPTLPLPGAQGGGPMSESEVAALMFPTMKKQ